jgi:hypothetical protein
MPADRLRRAQQEPRKLPILVELMGPAETGKTTLLRELQRQDGKIGAGLDLPKVEYAHRLLRRLGVFAPMWALQRHRDRWLDRREMQSIARLETWSRALERNGTAPAVTVFDHGPLYRLARLQEFGPALTRSEPFRRWWRASLAWWLDALDLVVRLDASDAVILRRARERGHWYLSADRAVADKEAFLASYRMALDAIVDGEGNQPTVVRFDSGAMAPESIATEVLRAIEQLRSEPGRRRSR